MDLMQRPDLAQWQAQGLAEVHAFGEKTGWRLRPETAQQVADMLHWAQENRQPVALREADAALPEAPVWLDVSRLDAVRQYPAADFIIEVETGMTFGALSGLLAENGQAFPLSYSPSLTLAEILAEDRPALETGLRGYTRDYTLKTEIAAPDGQLTISGADVVKNVTGYDLNKLYVGGRNAFGVLTTVTLKLAARPEDWRLWQVRAPSLAEAKALCRSLLAGRLPLAVCELCREGDVWQLWLAMAGDALLLDEAEAILRDLPGQAPERVAADRMASVLESLRQWSEGLVVAEAALPLSAWPVYLEQVMARPGLEQTRWQVRPAAGLVYAIAEEPGLDALRALQAEAQALEGFVQIMQMPVPDPALLAEFNLPDSPEVRRLLKTLKTGYDPHGILFTPQLPI